MQSLKIGSFLRNGTYRIEKVLGQGGFGITYLATDITLERKVAIKEFFPKDYCDRDGATSQVSLGTQNTADFVKRLKSKFLKEARNIARFDHPGVIRIHAAFEENNTAYYVMEYILGGSLSEKVKHDGPLPPERALRYIEKVGEALEYVHAQKINHLDVKPANIMLRESDDTPILIDFGLSKQYDSEGHETSTTQTGISHGFAPMEQYNDGGVREFSPQTDLYSLAATLYYLLSGVVPPHAPCLVDEDLTFPATIPPRFVASISKAMSCGCRNRHKTIECFLNELLSCESSSKTDNRDNGIAIDAEQTQIQNVRREYGDNPNQPLNIQSGRQSRASVVEANSQSQYEASQAELRQKAKVTGLDPVIQNLISNMVYVEGGSFMMGSKSIFANRDEKPEHLETVESFHIGKYEVTQLEWNVVMGNNPSKFKGDDLPVENVSWDDCQKFISNLNAKTGKNFRLPTEGEWEYAARGGNLSRGYKYSGSNDIGNVAWHMRYMRYWSKSHPVGTKSANELGLYDMSGNVCEWTSDNWCDDYNKSRTSPNLVCRGGGWCTAARYCRVSARYSFGRTFRNSGLGLRLAL